MAKLAVRVEPSGLLNVALSISFKSFNMPKFVQHSTHFSPRSSLHISPPTSRCRVQVRTPRSRSAASNHQNLQQKTSRSDLARQRHAGQRFALMDPIMRKGFADASATHALEISIQTRYVLCPSLYLLCSHTGRLSPTRLKGETGTTTPLPSRGSMFSATTRSRNTNLPPSLLKPPLSARACFPQSSLSTVSWISLVFKMPSRTL